MTPFRSMRKWVENLVRFRQGRRELPEDLCGLICLGVSLTDNVPGELLDRYLAVRTASSPKTDLVVVRLFDLSDFQLMWEQAKTRATASVSCRQPCCFDTVQGSTPLLRFQRIL